MKQLLAYFRAFELGPGSRVARVDKLSLAITVSLSIVFLGERLNWRLGAGVAMIVVGAILTIGS